MKRMDFYLTPVLEDYEVVVEQGFSASSGGTESVDDSDAGTDW